MCSAHGSCERRTEADHETLVVGNDRIFVCSELAGSWGRRTRARRPQEPASSEHTKIRSLPTTNVSWSASVRRSQLPCALHIQRSRLVAREDVRKFHRFYGYTVSVQRSTVLLHR